MSSDVPDCADTAQDAVEQAAKAAGIQPDRVDDQELIPTDAWQTGAVYCSRTRKRPDPPYTVVANYPLPGGGREILANDVYADLLKKNTRLKRTQAEAYALALVGMGPGEIGDVIGRTASTVERLLKDSATASVPR